MLIDEIDLPMEWVYILAVELLVALIMMRLITQITLLIIKIIGKPPERALRGPLPENWTGPASA